MIFLATDFGLQGPYVGEMHAAVHSRGSGHTVVDLIHDLPRFRPRLAAYLLRALVSRQPRGSVFVCVVDPGVGTPQRKPVWLEADGRLLVGPDNGLLQVVARAAAEARWSEILWRPRRLSASFHGRDLFAPVAAMLAAGEPVRARRLRRYSRFSTRWPADLPRILYVDGFGNLVTGIRASRLGLRDALHVAGRCCRRHRVFGEAPVGQPFWYANSMGLAEIAVPLESAARVLAAEAGDAVAILAPRDIGDGPGLVSGPD
jgi:S-adenosylmethionine hydrolase